MVELDCVIPSIKKLNIQSFIIDDPFLNVFFSKCIPESLQLLNINFEKEAQRSICDFYMNGFENALGKVIKEVYLNELVMSQTCFETIVKASSKADKLTFRYCSIDSSTILDFSGPIYSTSYISFRNSGQNGRSMWTLSNGKFQNITMAISTSGLSKSLNKINVHDCGGITVKKAKEILKSVGLSNVNVEDKHNKPT